MSCGLGGGLESPEIEAVIEAVSRACVSCFTGSGKDENNTPLTVSSGDGEDHYDDYDDDDTIVHANGNNGSNGETPSTHDNDNDNIVDTNGNDDSNG